MLQRHVSYHWTTSQEQWLVFSGQWLALATGC